MAAFRSKGAWCAGTTSVSFTMPTTHVAGDLLLMFIHTCNNAITTPPGNGWQLLSPSPQSTGTANTALGVRLTVYWKIAASSSEAAQTVGVTSGTATNGLTIAISDPNGTPFDVTPTGSVQAASAANFTCPTITTVNDNCLIINAVALDNDTNSSTAVTAQSNASLASITRQHGQTVSNGTGGGIYIATGVKETAGAVNGTTGTVAAAARAMLTIAVRPVVVVDGSVTAVPATQTADAIAPTVTATKNATVSAVTADQAASGIALTVVGTSPNVTVTAIPANASADGTPPVITGVRNASVTAVVAGSTASAQSPTVLGVKNTVIAAVAAAAIAMMPIPTIEATRNAAVTTPPSLAAAEAISPAVAAQRQVSISAIPASALASATSPSITAEQNVTVQGVSAQATASGVPPIIEGAINAAVQAVSAQAMAEIPDPVITSDIEILDANIVSMPALATASFNLPSITAVSNQTVVSVPAEAIASIRPPKVRTYIPNGIVDVGSIIVEYDVASEATEYILVTETIELELTPETIEYNLISEFTEYILSTEVKGMAYIGATVKLKATFPADAGDLSELTEVKCIITDSLKNEIETIDTPSKVTDGVYETPFTVPDGGDLTVGWQGKLGTDLILLTRNTLAVKWRD